MPPSLSEIWRCRPGRSGSLGRSLPFAFWNVVDPRRTMDRQGLSDPSPISYLCILRCTPGHSPARVSEPLKRSRSLLPNIDPGGSIGLSGVTHPEKIVGWCHGARATGDAERANERLGCIAVLASLVSLHTYTGQEMEREDRTGHRPPWRVTRASICSCRICSRLGFLSNFQRPTQQQQQAGRQAGGAGTAVPI